MATHRLQKEENIGKQTSKKKNRTLKHKQKKITKKGETPKWNKLTHGWENVKLKTKI
jgi:hypothetical protein